MSRKIFKEPNFLKIEQGAIFNGGISEIYKNVELYAIIITPRCDIVNHKISFYNYLPVIPFKIWLYNEFWQIFHKRIYTDAKNKLKSILNNNSLSDNIIGVITYEKLFETYNKKISKKKDKDKFKLVIEELIDLDESISFNNDTKEKYFKKHIKVYNSIILELIDNKNPNYHIIESWRNNDECFIVLLREIRKISENLGILLPKGIHQDDYNKIVGKLDDIDISSDFLFVNTILKSPFIEHLIQRFTNNFNKIGVEDCRSNILNNILQNYKI